MKLIIDISDKTYEIIRDMMYFYNSQRSGRAETKEIITAIKNGTPLPKGHGRLIDGSKLEQFTQLPNMTFELLAIDIFEAPTIIEADKENERVMTKEEAIKELYDIADQMPSMECKEWIEALGLAIKSLENQKTGHWIETDMDIYECSECHKGLALLEKENYCPNCGAKMERRNR